MQIREGLAWGALGVATLTNVVVLAATTGRHLDAAPVAQLDASLNDAKEEREDSNSAGSRPDVPRPVPLARLLANPAEFDGRRVTLSGYVGYRRSAHGASFLYASEGDAVYEMTANAVFLELSELDASRFEGACEVAGRFRPPVESSRDGGSILVERVLSRKFVGGDGGIRVYKMVEYVEPQFRREWLP